MKTKSFSDLIKTKLSQEQLDEIERQAQLEVAILKSIKKLFNSVRTEFIEVYEHI